MRTLAVILLIVGASQHRAGFEFRGLKTGVTEPAIRAALLELRTAQISRNVECIADHPHTGKMCSFGPYYAVLSDSGTVWGIAYNFKNDPESGESVLSFAKAFEEKYGKPTVSTRSYVNGFGNQFTATEETWDRGTQRLSIEEVCGEVGNHCVRIHDVAYAPRTKPKI